MSSLRLKLDFNGKCNWLLVAIRYLPGQGQGLAATGLGHSVAI